MSLGSIKLIGASAAAGLAALALAGGSAELRARGIVARLTQSRPGLTITAARVDWVGGGVTLRGLAYTASGACLRVASLRFSPGGGVIAPLGALLVPPARAFPTGGGATVPSDARTPPAPDAAQAPGVATATDVVIDYQGVTYTIPKIEVAGTALSGADLAAMLDVKSTETIENRLRRLTAASVSIPEIKADTMEGEFEQHWDQQQVLLAGIKDGKAAAGSAGPGILKTKSAKATSVAETGGLQMTGVDMGQIVHVATIARTDESEQQQVLAQSLVVSAIKLHDEGQGPSITMATLKEAGLKARSLALISQARSLLLATGKPGDPAVDAFVRDIANSVSVDLLQADDLVVTSPKSASEGSARLARVTVTDVRDRKIGDVAMQKLRYDQAANHIALASAELKDLILPASLNGKGVPAFAGLEMAYMSVDMDTAEEGQAEKRLAFDIAHAGFSAPGAQTDALPAKSTAVVDGFRINVRPDMSPMLIALGYPRLDVSMHLTTSFDQASQRLSIDDWTFNGTDMGRAVLKLELGKVTSAILSTDPDVQKTATASMLFKGIDLSLADAGLVDRLLAYRAAQDGIGVAQERENAIDLVRNKLPLLAGDPAKLKPIEDAVARFIADPKLPLHIAVSSVDGLGAADAGLLNDPNALLDKLSVVATAGR